MKTKYLQAMGIQSWRLRKGESYVEFPAEVNSPAKFYQLAVNGQNFGMVIASASTERERQLLLAIFKALNAEFTEVQSLDGQQPVLSFGPHPTAICTHSLTEMLNQPLLKAAVWRTLNQPGPDGTVSGMKSQ
jgi:DNA polymerase III psi subunit